MFDSLDISASGLAAQRLRMDTVSAIFAPNQATRGEGAEKPGVHVRKIEQDMSPFNRKFDPGHPDAGPDGYVLTPNIDMSIEFVNALEASRAYEANATT